LLYKSGWSGIHVDMNPAKIEVFLKNRPNDINICCAVSSSNGKFVIANKGRTTERLVPYDPNKKYDDEEIVDAKTIENVMQQANRNTIDYVNIDCEGHDFEVLKMLDLEKYSVKILTIEALDKSSEVLISNYMSQRGYTLSDKLHWTLLFVKSR
jgi:FkbM family methyltransferase